MNLNPLYYNTLIITIFCNIKVIFNYNKSFFINITSDTNKPYEVKVAGTDFNYKANVIYIYI